jgi:hypothetical protein
LIIIQAINVALGAVWAQKKEAKCHSVTFMLLEVFTVGMGIASMSLLEKTVGFFGLLL